LGNLVERPTIKSSFEPKYAQIVDLLEAEMDSTKRIFDVQKKLKDTNQEILVNRNMPDVSGALKWCQEMKDRISKPMDSFKRLVDNPISHEDQMVRVDKKFKELTGLLEDFSMDIYKDWCNHVGKLSDNNLEKNLIKRDPQTKAIDTNFDPQVNKKYKKF
jgi:dynein heavy chain, axonemal